MTLYRTDSATYSKAPIMPGRPALKMRLQSEDIVGYQVCGDTKADVVNCVTNWLRDDSRSCRYFACLNPHAVEEHMKIRVGFFSIFQFAVMTMAWLLSTAPAVAQDSARADSKIKDYLIQSGDLLEVSVWREEYLECEVAVQPDGMISFPLVGVLRAAGSTVGELQIRVAERLVTIALQLSAILNLAGMTAKS